MKLQKLIMAGSGLLLASCATVPPAPGPEDIELPADFATEYRPPAGVSEDWWTGFEDPDLNRLVEAALTENLDIAATAQRLRAAQAVLRAERSDRIPSLDAGASSGVDIDLDSSGTEDYANAGISAFFDPDISGRLSAEIQAAAASVAAAEYLTADQRRLVAAEVAQQYIELRRTGERLALLEESTELQEQTLQVVTLRFEAGLSANLDVRRAAADVAQTRAQRGLLELQRSQASNTLAVLTGQPPRGLPALSEEPAGIPQFSGGPPRGVPADLLRRRPDVLVAEARMVQAAAEIGIQRSDLLPSLTIPGNLSAGDGSIDGLLSDFLLTIGASLDLPLFDGGRRRAEITAAEYEAEARFAEYRLAALNSLGDVENALVAIEAFQSRNADLSSAIEESETAFDQSNALYREGLATLFDVLDAQRQLISSRQSLIDSQANLASAIVALYAATGEPVRDTPD